MADDLRDLRGRDPTMDDPTVDPDLLKQVTGLTEVNRRGQAPIELKFPSELNDILSKTRRLHVFDKHVWPEYEIQHDTLDHCLKLARVTTNISISDGMKVPEYMYWTTDSDETWLVFKDELRLNLQEVISALYPLCQKLEHITIGFDDNQDIHTHGSKPFTPMRSVHAVCFYPIFAPLHDSLRTVSRCFPCAKSLVLDCDSELPSAFTSIHLSGIPLSSLRRLEIRIKRNLDTLDNLFLSLSSSCQNIESLTVTSYRTLIWDKSGTAIRECKLPYLTDIRLESRLYEEHYALPLIIDLLRHCRVMSPKLKFVSVESLELGDVVMKSVEWSRTYSDCGLQFTGASAAVPITDLIDLTTSDLKEVTVCTLVSCEIHFGQSGKSPQSPKEFDSLREIRFFGSENSLSKSDRNKLLELYPYVKVTTKENQESQEPSDESEEGDIVPDEGAFETTKKECCKRVGADGGRLRLESFGIELEIPPGAIDSKDPQEISLRVLTNTPNLGNCDEMSVCFGVQCLAPGYLDLRSPVTYTIPHCAIATQYSSLEVVLYTGEGEYTSDAKFKERILLTRSKMPNCIIKEDVLRLQIDHFSWFIFGFITKPFFRGKRMYCLPFAEKPPPEERVPVILRVHLYDDIKGNEQMIMRKENRVGFDVIHPATELPINVTEKDVTMTCFNKDDRVGEAIVKYNDLWRGADMIRSFRLDLTNQPDRALVDLKVGQEGQRQEELVCIFRFTPTRSPRHHDRSTVRVVTDEEITSTVRVVTDEEITNLAGLLPGAKYSRVCEELGFGYNYTQQILIRHLLDSTTAFKEVLQEWKDKAGVMVDLDKALMRSNLGGLIREYKKQK